MPLAVHQPNRALNTLSFPTLSIMQINFISNEIRGGISAGSDHSSENKQIPALTGPANPISSLPPIDFPSKKEGVHWVYNKTAEWGGGVKDRELLHQLDICSNNPNTPTDASLVTEGEKEGGRDGGTEMGRRKKCKGARNSMPVFKCFYVVWCVLVCSPNFPATCKGRGLFGTALLPSLIFRPANSHGGGVDGTWMGKFQSAQNVKPSTWADLMGRRKGERMGERMEGMREEKEGGRERKEGGREVKERGR
ncbi:hypothetical protein L345_15288, partial [Ophiophagus hannah]